MLLGALWCLYARAQALAQQTRNGRTTTSSASRVVLVHLHPPIDFSQQELFADTVLVQTQPAASRQESRERVYQALSAFVRESQTVVSSFIRHSFRDEKSAATVFGRRIESITPLWIQNTLIVRMEHEESDEDEAATTTRRSQLRRFFHETLRWMPGVLDVEDDSAMVRLLDTTTAAEVDLSQTRSPSEFARYAYTGDAPQKNIELLHAPALWDRNVKGEGIVVANIDSGVRYSHEALRDTFRGEWMRTHAKHVIVAIV